MNRDPSFRNFLFLACGIVLGGLVFTGAHRAVLPAAVAAAPPDKDPDLVALQGEVSRLKGMVPDQSHAMADVAYHFANVWFAGQKQNWPLAKFYLDETRSHLSNWGVWNRLERGIYDPSASAGSPGNRL